ncbi:stage III sporulation protein AA [Mediterraneibacter agrestimuris]|uniref:stage III sporulation protein AA n=1 Tax=Mediterraneibacter agrestimuris TaxID=2941333 RepID=UPI00203A730B|nr:stage III sporulation protein AA [Mediterraneibacter agrestimuris]
MREDGKRQQIFRILARGIRTVLEREHLDFNELQEIRLRIGKPLMIVYKNTELIIPKETAEKHLVTKDELRETLDYISHYSMYAYESEIRQGFITIEGGHRVGMTGKVILEKDRIKNMQYISSVNIRVAHEVIGCGNRVLPFLTKNKEICHTLIISPPRCGKTTLIRDLIRQISNGNTYVKGCTVGVVDERSELGGCHMGIAQNDMGIRTDILDCCPKADGMILLIRSMAPRVLAVDEIGGEEETRAIEYAMQCGCKLLASVHGTDLDEICGKPGLSRLTEQRRFERYVVLNNQKDPGAVHAIYDEWGNVLCRDL